MFKVNKKSQSEPGIAIEGFISIIVLFFVLIIYFVFIFFLLSGEIFEKDKNIKAKFEFKNDFLIYNSFNSFLEGKVDFSLEKIKIVDLLLSLQNPSNYEMFKSSCLNFIDFNFNYDKNDFSESSYNFDERDKIRVKGVFIKVVDFIDNSENNKNPVLFVISKGNINPFSSCNSDYQINYNYIIPKDKIIILCYEYER
jgi:hypothetical protein